MYPMIHHCVCGWSFPNESDPDCKVRWSWYNCMRANSFHVSFLMLQLVGRSASTASFSLNLWWSHCELYSKHLSSASVLWSHMCKSADEKFIQHVSFSSQGIFRGIDSSNMQEKAAYSSLIAHFWTMNVRAATKDYFHYPLIYQLFLIWLINHLVHQHHVSK